MFEGGGGYKEEKLISASNDGNILCCDSQGKFFAAHKINSEKTYLRCLNVNITSNYYNSYYGKICLIVTS